MVFDLVCLIDTPATVFLMSQNDMAAAQGAPNGAQPSFWQVNHKKTGEFEVSVGEIWAPNDPNNKSWDLSQLKPGDIVYSFQHGHVVARGIVLSHAAPKNNPQISLHRNAAKLKGHKGVQQKLGLAVRVDFQRLSLGIKPLDYHVQLIKFVGRGKKTGLQIDPVSGALEGRQAYLNEMTEAHAKEYDNIIATKLGAGSPIPTMAPLALHLFVNQPSGTVNQLQTSLAVRGTAVFTAPFTAQKKQEESRLDLDIEIFNYAIGLSSQVDVLIIESPPGAQLFSARLTSVRRAQNTVQYSISSLAPGTVTPGLSSVDLNYAPRPSPSSTVTSLIPSPNNLLGVYKKGPSMTSSTNPSVSQASVLDPSEQILRDALQWEPELVRTTLDSLRDGSPQIILTGPPGTGKTFCAERIANFLVGAKTAQELETPHPDVKTVQFHASYSYADFVEGLRPVPSGQGGFEFRSFKGVVLELAEAIEKDHRPRVLIIDEINRANVPSVFGELMYLLEYRNRSIRLQNSPHFSLPEKLSIIGTMNTADRSVKGLDAALRRRFDFIELKPQPDLVIGHYAVQIISDLTPQQLRDGLKKLNEQLERDLSLLGSRRHARHLAIGHSYLMKSSMSCTSLRRIWQNQLLPLIEEYFVEAPDMVEGYKIENYWPC